MDPGKQDSDSTCADWCDLVRKIASWFLYCMHFRVQTVSDPSRLLDSPFWCRWGCALGVDIRREKGGIVALGNICNLVFRNTPIVHRLPNATDCPAFKMRSFVILLLVAVLSTLSTSRLYVPRPWKILCEAIRNLHRKGFITRISHWGSYDFRLRAPISSLKLTLLYSRREFDDCRRRYDHPTHPLPQDSIHVDMAIKMSAYLRRVRLFVPIDRETLLRIPRWPHRIH